jgi:hypothetical protein
VGNVTHDLERGDSTWVVREWLLEHSAVDTWGVEGWKEWERVWAAIDDRGCSVFAVPADMTVTRPDRLELETADGVRFEEELQTEPNPILGALKRLVLQLER